MDFINHLLQYVRGVVSTCKTQNIKAIKKYFLKNKQRQVALHYNIYCKHNFIDRWDKYPFLIHFIN